MLIDKELSQSKAENQQKQENVLPANVSSYKYGTKMIRQKIYFSLNTTNHQIYCFKKYAIPKEQKTVKEEGTASKSENARTPEKKQKTTVFTSKKPFPEEKNEKNEKKKPSLVEVRPPVNEKQLQQNLLKMFCNNTHYYELVKRDNSQLKYYAWFDEQDKLLWSFKFCPNNYRTGMACLLRYKNMSKIRERMIFLGMEIDSRLSEELQMLQPQSSRPQQQQPSTEDHKMGQKLKVQPIDQI